MILVWLLAAALQAPAAAAPAPAADPQALQDRVATLVGQGKCAEAKDAATAAGDANLSAQVDELCGVHPTSGGRSGGGEGRGRGGGGGRGGGSRPPGS